VARVISKLGLGSRTQATQWVRDGRVRVNQQVVRDAEYPVRQGVDRIEIEGRESSAAPRIARNTRCAGWPPGRRRGHRRSVSDRGASGHSSVWDRLRA